MSTAVELDTSVLESLDFHPVCEIKTIFIKSGQVLSKCDQPAAYTADIHQHIEHTWLNKFLCEDCRWMACSDECTCGVIVRVQNVQQIGRQ